MFITKCATSENKFLVILGICVSTAPENSGKSGFRFSPTHGLSPHFPFIHLFIYTLALALLRHANASKPYTLQVMGSRCLLTKSQLTHLDDGLSPMGFKTSLWLES